MTLIFYSLHIFTPLENWKIVSFTLALCIEKEKSSSSQRCTKNGLATNQSTNKVKQKVKKGNNHDVENCIHVVNFVKIKTVACGGTSIQARGRGRGVGRWGAGNRKGGVLNFWWGVDLKPYPHFKTIFYSLIQTQPLPLSDHHLYRIYGSLSILRKPKFQYGSNRVFSKSDFCINSCAM